MLSRQYVKFCDLKDFAEPDLVSAIRSLLPEGEPLSRIERKRWEYAMLVRFVEDLGLKNDRTEALAVGAGDERIVFWLANHLGRVVATDIYGDGEFAEQEARISMLHDPSAHAPFPYRENRLEVMWMDARSLCFPDASFDLVFSISSIEHFGARRDIAAAAREIGRVLRPGGHAFIVTECFVRRHPLNAAPVDFAVRAATLGRRRRGATLRRRTTINQVLTTREVQSLIIGPSKLRLMQPLDTSISPESWDNLGVLSADGELTTRTGQKYPHILLQLDRSVFTSVCLALEKV